MLENGALKSNTSSFNQIKPVGGFPSFEYHLAFFEMRWRGRLRQNLDVVYAHPLEERVGSQAILNFLIIQTHRCRLFPLSPKGLGAVQFHASNPVGCYLAI